MWRVYKVTFKKPIEHETVVEFDMLSLSHRSADAIELLGLLAKEGWQKANIGEYHSYKQALSKYTLSAILLSEPVLKIIRRQLRTASPGLKVELDEIKTVLASDVLKREVLEGEKALSAQKQVTKAARRAQKSKDDVGEAATTAPSPSTMETTPAV